MMPINININYIIYAFIILLIICILLFMLFRFSLYKWFIWTGISNIIVGIFLLILNIQLPIIIDSLKNYQNEIDSGYILLATSIIGPIKTNMYIISVVLVVIGIISIIIYTLINNKKQNKLNELLNQL